MGITTVQEAIQPITTEVTGKHPQENPSTGWNSQDSLSSETTTNSTKVTTTTSTDEVFNIHEFLKLICKDKQNERGIQKAHSRNLMDRSKKDNYQAVKYQRSMTGPILTIAGSTIGMIGAMTNFISGDTLKGAVSGIAKIGIRVNTSKGVSTAVSSSIQGLGNLAEHTGKIASTHTDASARKREGNSGLKRSQQQNVDNEKNSSKQDGDDSKRMRDAEEKKRSDTISKILHV